MKQDPGTPFEYPIWVAKGQVFESLTTAFLDTTIGAELEEEKQGLNGIPVDASVPNSGLN